MAHAKPPILRVALPWHAQHVISVYGPRVPRNRDLDLKHRSLVKVWKRIPIRWVSAAVGEDQGIESHGGGRVNATTRDMHIHRAIEYVMCCGNVVYLLDWCSELVILQHRDKYHNYSRRMRVHSMHVRSELVMWQVRNIGMRVPN